MQSVLRDLLLSYNSISHIHRDAFVGLSSLNYLELQHNTIKHIHVDAFLPLTSLEELNLSENEFEVFPSRGLTRLRYIKAYNNPNVRDFPGPEHFPSIIKLTLPYAYHCCLFADIDNGGTVHSSDIRENITFIDENAAHLEHLLYVVNDTEDYSSYEDMWKDAGSVITDGMVYAHPRRVMIKSSVTCLPTPGAFQPCKDLMGWWFTRCGVWVVFLLAIIGNVTVLMATLLSKKINVPRFLVCHLAFADFIMGVYLAILAILDAATFGEFRKHAVVWQTSRGCELAGFLAVFSSVLSVYSLVVITIERLYAITHAMNLKQRMSFALTGNMMVSGWIFSIVMAALPLFGISNYSKVAFCLPFETRDAISLGYIAFLLLFNILAFLLIFVCYGKIYWSIRGSSIWSSHDGRIARRMAVLIFTDLLCWFPISFVSLTSLFGLHLVSLEEAKIFIIFVLPVNACANPFLYAILTKQFQKDLSDMCRRLEETSQPKQLNGISDETTSRDPANSQSMTECDTFGNAIQAKNELSDFWIIRAFRRLFRKRQTAAGNNVSTQALINKNPQVISFGEGETPQLTANEKVCDCHRMIFGKNLPSEIHHNSRCIAYLLSKRRVFKGRQPEALICENLTMLDLQNTSRSRIHKTNDISNGIVKNRKSQANDPRVSTYIRDKRDITTTTSNCTDITYVESESDVNSRGGRCDTELEHSYSEKESRSSALCKLAESEEISDSD